MDKETFRIIGSRITHQALALLITELEATKLLSSSIEPGCMSACELPRRWGLPCKHWMYSAVSRAIPLPLSLVHPRWFLDAPAAVEKLEEAEEPGEAEEAEEPAERQHQGDRYRDRGANMAMSAAVRAIEYQKQLTGPPNN